MGTFIARISKGRTVREFVIGVLGIPSGVSFVWFAVFGGAAIDLQLGGTDLGGIVGTPEIALFTMLEEFPIAGLTSFVVIVLVALFFVSGADAASLVMGMLSSRGSLTPARPVVIVWGVSTGAAAAVLLLAGGLSSLQQAAIIAAAPFTIVMAGLCISVFKGLAEEAAPLIIPEPAPAPTEAGARELGGLTCPTTHIARSAASSTCSRSSTACASTGRRSSRARAAPARAGWVPAVDIFASGQDLVIRCELAGVAKEEIDVSLTDGRLWISGERSGAPEDGVDYYVRERRYGPFERSVKLTRGIRGDQINATVVDGLLEIVIEGGAEPSQHEQIEVAGADSGQVRLDVSP